MRSNGVSLAEAASMAGCSEPELTDALRGRFSHVAAERVARLAQALGSS
jgi:hypothetical protein